MVLLPVVRMCVLIVCVRARVRACVHACVHACVRRIEDA